MQFQLGEKMNLIDFVPFLTVLITFIFVSFLIAWIKNQDEGSLEMKKVAAAVREGASAFLKREYKSVAVCGFFVFLVLVVLSQKKFLPVYAPLAFVSGLLFSALAGFIGMNVATLSSNRMTESAKNSLNKALRIGFSSGSVMGLIVVSLALLNVSVWYLFLQWVYRSLEPATRMFNIASTLFSAGMGASAQALFARVGGGIYTKGADVGADLVGKVEVGIPEDDARNPATIADNVGDNVGDIAGMGADLYESYLDSIVAAMALSLAAGLSFSGMFLPILIGASGILASLIGFFLVHAKENATQAALLSAMRRGVYITGILVAGLSLPIVLKVLGPQYLGIYWAILCGLIAGNLIGFFTEYYTSDNYPPTRLVAEASKTGTATVILEGYSWGMSSTFLPVLTVAIASLLSFYLAGGSKNIFLGLYGIAITAVGMLSTLGITLATDSYGPVADNAGGNAEMTHQPPIVRERTDSLDALGNTTAATGKGFAIGSAALTALALIAAYRSQILQYGGKIELSLMNPRLMAGLFIGAMYPFFFSSLAIRAVGRTAQKIVLEVRRQFKEIVGLMEGKAKPEYAKAVDICTAGALKEMMFPSLITIILPIMVGIFLGLEGVIGLLTGALACGFVVAVTFANSGAIWDNSKKYIEKGNLGGKGSAQHKAAVIGDTVGDPFKDTAGPSLNILIKLMSIISIVFASFIMKYTFFK